MSKPRLRSVPRTEAPQAAAAGSGRVLRIVSGLHAGASRPLADQEMLVVGSGDDCDIVLADTGVAAHHALITLVGGGFTLRALDAPARIEGRPLHPGDPVAVQPLQRIDLGEAAIAFGPQDVASWDALFPEMADRKSAPRSSKPLLRRLPLIAASAVLALAAVAVIAALLPRSRDQVDAHAYLQSLVPQHRISQSEISADLNGVPMLSGTVESDSVRDGIQEQLTQAGVRATLALRTGEDMARDVQEVARMAGLNVQTRYLGEGRVEIDGAVEDEARFEQVMNSRAMHEVGAAELVRGPGLALANQNVDEDQDSAAENAAQAPVDIVSIVRGPKAYVVDTNGVQYPVGAMIPGYGVLVTIGKSISVQAPNGEILKIRPLTAAELAQRAAASSFDNVVGTPGATSASQATTTTSQQPVNTADPKIDQVKQKQ